MKYKFMYRLYGVDINILNKNGNLVVNI